MFVIFCTQASLYCIYYMNIKILAVENYNAPYQLHEN